MPLFGSTDIRAFHTPVLPKETWLVRMSRDDRLFKVAMRVESVEAVGLVCPHRLYATYSNEGFVFAQYITFCFLGNISRIQQVLRFCAKPR